MRDSPLDQFEGAGLLHNFIDTLPFSVVILDNTGQVQMINDRWQEFHHSELEPHGSQKKGDNFLDPLLKHSNPDLAELGQSIQRILDNNETTHKQEISLPNPTDPRVNHWFVYEVREYEHKGSRFCMVNQINISRRKQSEVKLQRLYDLVEYMPVGLLLLKTTRASPPDFRVIQMNNHSEKLFGLNEDEVVGNKITEVLPDITKTDVMECLRSTLNERKTHDIEEFYSNDPRHNDRVWDLKIFPLTDQFVGVSFEDITTEHEDKQKLRYMANHDDLTDLYNRNFFFERSSGEFERARRYQRPL
ncbi:MAG: PAS domain-containing protein, partial [bacterium]